MFFYKIPLHVPLYKQYWGYDIINDKKKTHVLFKPLCISIIMKDMLLHPVLA